MADLEKVKKGLECCKKSTIDDPFQMCGECPYNDESIFVQDCRAILCEDTLEVMKIYEDKEVISDVIHDTAKEFRQTIVRCKDCDNKECWGRAGDVVCGIDGMPHRPDWFCAYGERKEG